MRELKYYEALSEGLVQAMERDSSIFVTGIAVDYASGIFGSTVEATRRFGPERVFDSPAMENAMTGICIGAAAMGKRPMMVHPRNDFMFLAFDQLINLAAKWRYMYGGNAGSVPVVVRAVVGKGWGQGATHSQSLQSLLAHFPGLQVVLPALPQDAKGLTIAALQSNAPTVILEHRTLYGISGPVDEAYVPTPIGKARVVQEGTDVTIVATSFMVIEAMRAAEELAKEGVSVELVDLRSIRPLDEETILSSVRKTGRLVVADTSWELCGVVSEIAALAAEKAFHSLKAPVRRIALADCPAPVSMSLEAAFYPKASTIARAVLATLGRTHSHLGDIDLADDFKGPY
ncbi:acetoin dehydrogenase [Skermanella aerolata]|uniref:Acetoin dehydrogenase n=1 Tax=Skermanella aerolata TaxID=393310 RepID=A0A512DV25_9PROT|nr:transketolase C-terminal domain-containing protein [Skermanella aerolata]KJB94795.1 dehydrogenase [Skermanella aerolata KACC 11604]GEO40318.1 acetoin dehydrogenase [Skermanella aerolata]